MPLCTHTGGLTPIFSIDRFKDSRTRDHKARRDNTQARNRAFFQFHWQFITHSRASAGPPSLIIRVMLVPSALCNASIATPTSLTNWSWTNRFNPRFCCHAYLSYHQIVLVLSKRVQRDATVTTFICSIIDITVLIQFSVQSLFIRH